MAPPPRLLQFLALFLFLSAVLLLAVVSAVHGTRHHQADADNVGGEQRVGIGGGEMTTHNAVARRWSRTVVRRGGGGHGGGGHGHGGHGHGHGHGRGHGTGDDGHGKPRGTPFYPRTVTGGHPRRSAAPVTGRRPSSAVAGNALLVVLLLLRL